MLKIGLTNKAKIEIDPALGYPVVTAIHRILQGEPIETVCSHDLTLQESATIFGMSLSFSTSLKANPIKLEQANTQMEALFNKLKKDLLDSNENITQADIDNISQSPEFLEKFNSIRWMDFLTGNISSYTVSEYPNADVIWNEELKIWQVVATTEILPDQTITLPKPNKD